MWSRNRPKRALLPALLSSILLSYVSVVANAATLYVDLNNPAPVSPYTNWLTAATNIQDAVDAAVAEDEVVVTNGLYSTGGRAVYGTMTNRVAIDKPLLVRSLNGPLVTFIAGQPAPGTTNNGDGGIRCVYVGVNAVLSGFTLTNGHTRKAGDIVKEQSGGGVWCTARGVVTNCALTGNSAYQYGGGAYSYYGMLINCTLSGNSAINGGGAYGDTDYVMLNNCTLTGNSASDFGGGTYHGQLKNCTLTGNSAGYRGGGAYESTLGNCVVYYNAAAEGPNYYNSGFTYSCITPLAPGLGNIDDDPLLASATHLSAQSPCIGRGSPDYASGVDIDGEAWLNPPCMGADQFVAGAATGALTVAIAAAYTNVAIGSALSFVARVNGRLNASAWDFGDGMVLSNRAYASHAWAAPGLYEVRLTGWNDSFPGGVSATVPVRVTAQEIYYVNRANASPVFPYTNWAGAAMNIQQAIDAGRQMGRLVRVTNGVYASGGRAVFGTMTNRVAVAEGVEVRSENGPSVTFIVGQPAPGTMDNGDGAVRCVHVGANAVLSGFTLTNGYTRTAGDDYQEQGGGGVWCEASGVVTNCTLTGNKARLYGGGAWMGTLNNCTLSGNWGSYYGGGAFSSTLINCNLTKNSAWDAGGAAYSGTLINCTLTTNWSRYHGGGSRYGTLINCTLTGNSASYGGGVDSGTLSHCTLTGNSASNDSGGAYSGWLTNSIVYYNTATYGPNYYGSAFAYSCTTPMPAGPGNLTNVPLFLNTNGWSNLRLQSNSPCINAGNNAYVRSLTDLDGNPRISGSAVDMGAYEFYFLDPFHAWLAQYGLPSDGSADDADSDHDGANNWQEWTAGTVPTNAASVFALGAPLAGPGGVTLTWASVTNRTYSIERAPSLAPPLSFSFLATNIAGLPETTRYTDTNAPPEGPAFYRVQAGP